jgi:hypothetical protein
MNHEKIIFDWLKEPHVVEFWDNSHEHRDDIFNFIYGCQQHYFDGTFQYFIGFVDDVLDPLEYSGLLRFSVIQTSWPNPTSASKTSAPKFRPIGSSQKACTP